MTSGFGGNPYGPAGTGKTETVKALGQALARQVCHFLCALTAYIATESSGVYDKAWNGVQQASPDRTWLAGSGVQL